MNISEKVAYIKGLAEGLALDKESKEGKLFAAIIDILDDIALLTDDLTEQIDSVDEDLAALEEFIYDDDDFCDGDCEDCDGCDDLDEYDDEDPVFEYQCPVCQKCSTFDGLLLLEAGPEMKCEHCGTPIDIETLFDFEDDEDEDEEE